jgi:hypothetical protein
MSGDQALESALKRHLLGSKICLTRQLGYKLIVA